jgi:hypothetical protein
MLVEDPMPLKKITKRKRSILYHSSIRERTAFFPPQYELEKLLETPVNQLKISLKENLVGTCIDELSDDLDRMHMRLRPKFYLSDGYGTCEGTANIGIAFWEVNERLRTLALRYLGERYDIWDIRMVLRHEVGHAFCYSYKLYRLKEFRKIFNVRGHFFNTYPLHERYKKNPWSHDFVNPCGDHYAQKHPDDDFAETFATLFDGRTNWKKEYRNRKGALEKLCYVDSLIKEWGRKSVLIKNDERKIYGPVEEISETVRQFFSAKRAQRN